MASILALMVPAPDDTANKKRVVRDMFVEFIATTVFVYTGTLSAVATGYWEQSYTNNGGNLPDVARILPISISFGISIMSLAFSIGHLTGGHMNPGVSLTMFFKRQMSLTKMLSYWIVQFLGAMLGAALMWGSTSNLQYLPTGDEGTLGNPPFLLGSTTLSPDITVGNGFLLEFMGSFFFYFVIAQTACDKRGAATSLFPPIPIGFILIVVHICLIPFTGCGVNPARTLGPSMVSCMYGIDCALVADQSWYWIYFIGPFLASFAVAEVTLWMEWDVDGASSEEEKDEAVVDAVEEANKD